MVNYQLAAQILMEQGLQSSAEGNAGPVKDFQVTACGTALDSVGFLQSSAAVSNACEVNGDPPPGLASRENIESSGKQVWNDHLPTNGAAVSSSVGNDNRVVPNHQVDGPVRDSGTDSNSFASLNPHFLPSPLECSFSEYVAALTMNDTEGFEQVQMLNSLPPQLRIVPLGILNSFLPHSGVSTKTHFDNEMVLFDSNDPSDDMLPLFA